MTTTTAINWTPELIEAGAQLMARMSSRKAAAILSVKIGQEVSRSALIGALNRAGKNGNSFHKALTTGNKNPRPRKPGAPRPAKVKKSVVSAQNGVRLRENEYIDLKEFFFLPVLPEKVVQRYEPKGTCQYILNDDMRNPEMCGKECNGSWCTDHRKTLFIPPETRTRPQHSASGGVKDVPGSDE